MRRGCAGRPMRASARGGCARRRRRSARAEEQTREVDRQRKEAEGARNQALWQRRQALIYAAFSIVLAFVASVASVGFYIARTDAQQQAGVAEAQRARREADS